MSDLFEFINNQVPAVNQTMTVSFPDILGNMSIINGSETVGSITEGVFGEAVIEMYGERAELKDSVIGNYDIVTDSGMYTAMDNAYGGENIMHFGENIAYSRPGILGSETWYGEQGQPLYQVGTDSFAQTTITFPTELNFTPVDMFVGMDSIAMGENVADISEFLSVGGGIIDLLEFI